MDTLREILDPEFLLRNSVYMSLLIGLACPLVGVYLVLRRMVFLGVALPQISSCGIACAFALHSWNIIQHDQFGENILAFIGSTVFTLMTLIVLAILDKRGGFVQGRIGTVYVLAGAWSILLLVLNPYGEHGLLQRLKGEIIAVTTVDLVAKSIAFGLVLLLLFCFRKELLLVSFDREMAVTLKKNVMAWDGVLYLLIGLTVSIAVLTVGPLVTFGFLILPPLMARLVARKMWQLFVLSGGIGVVTAFFGFAIALNYDLPVGATDVALLGGVYLVLFVVTKLIRLVRRPALAGERAAAA